jgi:hypothetical protein
MARSQAANFHPRYSEIDAIANGLALAYASRNATDARSWARALTEFWRRSIPTAQ